MVRFNEYLWSDDRTIEAVQEMSEEDFEYQLWYAHGIDLRCREARDLELWLDLTGNLDADIDYGHNIRWMCVKIMNHLGDNLKPLEPEFQKLVDENFWDLLS